MEKMFKELNGKQLGEKLYFRKCGEKYEISLGYTGKRENFDYTLNLVTVRQVANPSIKNTFDIRKLCNCVYDIDSQTCRKVGDPLTIVEDMTPLIENIVDWIYIVG